MTRSVGRSIAALVLLALLGGSRAPVGASSQPRSTGAQPITIPIELATHHLIVKVTVNGSAPLSFVLDTGAHAAIIRTDAAKALGLTLEGQATVRGAGPGSQTAQFVRGAAWSLVGLDGFSQPISLAVPMSDLPSAMGRPIDGIIGGEFIRQFVVEVDYRARHIRLHPRDSFTYTGPGQSIPIEFVNVSHPTLRATVTPAGSAPIERQFMFDIGAGTALALHSPFVSEQHLPGSSVRTIRSLGSAGAGGQVSGQLGRVDSLQIGSFTIDNPITLFSEDKAGALANAALAGNIGAQIAMRFHLYLDYAHQRIIFEPSATFGEPFDRAFSGLAIRARGADFRTFQITDVLEDSPATDAGVEKGDVITAIDGVPADRLTLAGINEMFEKPVGYTVTIRRGDRTMTVKLTPARLIEPAGA